MHRGATNRNRQTVRGFAAILVMLAVTIGIVSVRGVPGANLATTAMAPEIRSSIERVDTARAGAAQFLAFAEAAESTDSAAVPANDTARHLATGEASYYGPGFAGRPTANGEKFNPRALTAAHRTLPFGTRLRVTNLRNGRQVEVRVNDRGPYAHGRILDLSEGAAAHIGMVSSGTAKVKVEVLS